MTIMLFINIQALTSSYIAAQVHFHFHLKGVVSENKKTLVICCGRWENYKAH